MKFQVALEFLKHMFVLGVEARVVSPSTPQPGVEPEEPEDLSSLPQPAGFRQTATRKEIEKHEKPLEN